MKFIYYSVLFLLIIAAACNPPQVNENANGADILTENFTYRSQVELNWSDTVYVPIYSDIYSETKNTRFNLTATLSIRNTSMQDTMYLRSIDYYNFKGDLVRSFIKPHLVLNPLQSIEYVIEEDDTSGGTGASFLIQWGANTEMNPIFQGIMISTHGQQGISFLTNGVSLKLK